MRNSSRTLLSRWTAPASKVALLSYRTFLLGLLGAAVAACAAPVIRTPKEEVAQFPIFDVHSHHSLVSASTTEQLLEALNAAGIRWMNIFRRENEAGAAAGQLAQKYPDRFVLSFRPPIGRTAEMEGALDPGEVERISAEIEKALRSGLYKGLGEIIAYRGGRRPSNISPDSPVIRRVLLLGGQYKVPVTIHCGASGAEEMSGVLRAYPNTVVIWAHAGSYLSPGVMRNFLRDHPNLYFDLSAKHPPWTDRRFYRYPILFGEVIDEDWRRLFESYPDRFFLGFDLGGGAISTPLSDAREVADFFRTVLMQLTPATARKIAYDNAERLYKFK